MGKYFGTDGFRGEANCVLTAERAFAVGRFVGAAHRGQEILIGRDTRRSSPMLEQALAAGLTASGANVCLPGVLPTPAVSFAVKQLGFGGGVMISASHNPYTDNGIKLFDGKGEKPTDAALEALEDYLDGGAAEPPLAHGREIGTVHGAPEVAEAYLSYLRGAVKGNFKGLRVGLDTANGSAAAMAPSLFRALGATVTAIHTAPDGCNINRACGSTHLHDLQQLVVAGGLDVGFAFDGDADRCIAVNARGEVVDGDAILYIMGRHRQACGGLTGHAVVTTVMSNLGLQKALEPLGIACLQTAVGDRYVRERMQKSGAVLGGEPSGHIIFGDLSDTGDGMLTALLLAERICREGPLHTLTRGYEPYPQLVLNLAVTDKGAVMGDGRILTAVKGLESALNGSGRLLVRASGTEPVIRVMVEAKEPQSCREYAERVRKIIETGGYLL